MIIGALMLASFQEKKLNERELNVASLRSCMPDSQMCGLGWYSRKEEARREGGQAQAVAAGHRAPLSRGATCTHQVTVDYKWSEQQEGN